VPSLAAVDHNHQGKRPVLQAIASMASVYRCRRGRRSPLDLPGRGIGVDLDAARRRARRARFRSAALRADQVTDLPGEGERRLCTRESCRKRRRAPLNACSGRPAIQRRRRRRRSVSGSRRWAWRERRSVTPPAPRCRGVIAPGCLDVSGWLPLARPLIPNIRDAISSGLE